MTAEGEDTIQLPASTSAHGSKYTSPRLFGREKTVHELLGSGLAADVLLWRKKHLSAGVLVFATVVYILFEWCGYTVLSVLCNTLLTLIAVLFAWSLGASFMNRPPPRVPEIQLSEQLVHDLARSVQHYFNSAMATFRAIALGRNYILFAKTAALLWITGIVGSWADLLTLLYIAVIVAHVVPVVYDKYEDQIEHYLKVAEHELKKQYKKVDEIVMKKIPRAAKEKKAE